MSKKAAATFTVLILLASFFRDHLGDKVDNLPGIRFGGDGAGAH